MFCRGRLIFTVRKRKRVDSLELKKTIQKIAETKSITEEELANILIISEKEKREYLFQKAREEAERNYGKKIYIRGLIEFSNICKNDCFYCGLRKSNNRLDRYRLTEDDIVSCADYGYELGFRTVVLQSGEDLFFDDDKICRIVREIKKRHDDMAVTLSIGEKKRESYEAFYEAGTDRYLLRHETANRRHYENMHPENMSFVHRRKCLSDLKEIGYQTGCGFMVGSPGQSIHTLYEDIEFIRELQPHMVGIGPFLPQRDTPFGEQTARIEGIDSTEENSIVDSTLILISVLRLLFPKLLIPATTALGTAHPMGRELGILAGANVIMPNLSPVSVREKYLLYDGKICTGEEAAECINCLRRRVEGIGYQIVVDRGDCLE